MVHHFLTLQLQSPVIDEAAATEGQILLLAGLRGALPRLLVVYQALPWPGRCSSTLGCIRLGLCSATPLLFSFAPSSCSLTTQPGYFRTLCFYLKIFHKIVKVLYTLSVHFIIKKVFRLLEDITPGEGSERATTAQQQYAYS